MANYKAEIAITDFRALIKELRKIDPAYVRGFFSSAKEITKPVQDEITRGIPPSAPIRGMRPKSERGRLAWGIGRRARSTQIRVNRTVKRKSSFARGRTDQYSIAYVAVRSPGTAMSDMAGRSGTWVNKYEVSREHQINLFGRGTIVTRRYRMNDQGKAMITALNTAKGKASRFVWPSALKALPMALNQVTKLISKTNEVINRDLRRISGN